MRNHRGPQPAARSPRASNDIVQSAPAGRGQRAAGSMPAIILSLAMVVPGCAADKNQTRTEEKVPVSVATVEQKSVPLTIQAIGTVQPIATVAVRSQVGGQLTRVTFREGDDVRRGALLFVIDPRPFQATLAQAQANLARDEAQLRNAEAERARYAELVAKDYVTRQDFDKVTAAAEAARAIVAADRAAVENARLQLSYCQIRAPIDGRTGSLQVHAGNIVRANDTTPLVVINQIQPVNVQFSIPENRLTELRANAAAGMPVQATPHGSTAPAVGRLAFLDNAVDAETGTIVLKAAFPNRDRSLWPGQFVNVSIVVDERENAVMVPAQAVQTGQKGQYVYVVKADKGVEMRPVSVYRQVEQQMIIEKGVTPGETVVTDGQLRLTPKSKVEVKAAL